MILEMCENGYQTFWRKNVFDPAALFFKVGPLHLRSPDPIRKKTNQTTIDRLSGKLQCEIQLTMLYSPDMLSQLWG